MAICKMMITLSKAYITQNAHKQPKSISDVQTTGCILMHSNKVASRNTLQSIFLEKQPNKSLRINASNGIWKDRAEYLHTLFIHHPDFPTSIFHSTTLISLHIYMIHIEKFCS